MATLLATLKPSLISQADGSDATFLGGIDSITTPPDSQDLSALPGGALVPSADVGTIEYCIVRARCVFISPITGDAMAFVNTRLEWTQQGFATTAHQSLNIPTGSFAWVQTANLLKAPDGLDWTWAKANAIRDITPRGTVFNDVPSSGTLALRCSEVELQVWGTPYPPPPPPPVQASPGTHRLSEYFRSEIRVRTGVELPEPADE